MVALLAMFFDTDFKYSYPKSIGIFYLKQLVLGAACINFILALPIGTSKVIIAGVPVVGL
jgi:hypothetical protein